MNHHKPSYEDLLQQIAALKDALNQCKGDGSSRAQVALNLSQTGTFDWFVDTNQFFIDATFAELWGVNANDLFTKDLFILGIHPQDRQSVTKLIKSFNDQQSTQDFSLRIRVTGIHSDQSRWIEWAGRQVSNGNQPIRIMGYVRDVTTSVNDYQTLQMWENVFRHAKWGIAFVNADTLSIELINPKLAAMHGYLPHELIGKSYTHLLDTNDQNTLFARINGTPTTHHCSWESLHRHKKGHSFYVFTNMTMLNNKQMHLRYYIFNITDISRFKQTQQALSQSEQHYSQLFQNLNANFAVHEILFDEQDKPFDYRFLAINPAMEKAIGMKAQDVIGKTARQLFPETEQYWIDIFAQVAISGIPNQYENFSKELGRYFELKIFSPQKGLFATLANDVTEQTLARLKVIQIKDHFEQLFNLNPDAVVITRLSDGLFVNVNLGYTNLTGYTLDEIINHTTLEINIWVNIQERDGFRDLLIKNNRCTNFEARFRRKDGSIFNGMVSAVVLTTFEEPHILSVTRDITIRIEAEQALYYSQQALLESQRVAMLGSYKLDITTGMWSSSPILDQILGIPADFDKSIGGWLSIIHPDWREQMQEYILSDVIQNRQRFDKEYQIIRVADGRMVWVHGMGDLVMDQNNDLIAMIGTIQDITDRKDAEIIIQQQNQQLIALNATQNKLFSIIAHDLKNPFNSLINMSDLLADSISDLQQDEISDMASSIRDASVQAHDLLDNLLEWFRMQTGLLSPNQLSFNIKYATDNILSLFSHSVAKKNIRIINNMQPDLVVECDPDMTKTILRNLISNAIKFTPVNGRITIEGGRMNDTFAVKVCDNGVGIPPENISALFQNHLNISTHGTANEKGSGLGLVLCRELVELQGGRIWVDSSPGQGSTFSFSIPYRV